MTHHPAFELVDSVARITEYRHRGNGLRVLVRPDTSTEAATFMVTYLVGSRHEKPGLTGATHFLEHLMFKGTERHNRTEGTSVFQVLQRLGAQVNATTWLDRTNYYALLPATHVEVAMTIEADRMRGARIRPEDVDDERSVILNELDRGENEPLRRLHRAVFRTAFERHTYGHPTIGWREDVATMTADGLRGFYDTYYWPNNAVASVIGNVETGSALSLLDEHFAGIPASDAPMPEVATPEPPQSGPRRTTVRMAGEPPTVVMAWKAPEGTASDTDSLALLSMVLSAGKSSRLHRALVDRGVALNQVASASRFRDPGLFSITVLLAPDRSHEEAEEIVTGEVVRLVREGIDDGELARSRAQLRAHEAFSRDGPYSAAAQLNEAIAAGDWRLFATMRDRIDRLTVDDAVDAARRYLVERTLTLGRFEPDHG